MAHGHFRYAIPFVYRRLSDREAGPISQLPRNIAPAVPSVTLLPRRWWTCSRIPAVQWCLAALTALAIFFVILPRSSPAAVMPARHYTTADGLARDSVHCILKDRNGFLWFGTGEGISRFDGSGFTNYRVADGLPDRDVRSIVETPDETFLVGTGAGAARFDPYGSSPTHLFTPFPSGNSARVQSVKAVLEAQNAVWIGTEGGLIVVRNHRAAAFPLGQSETEPVVLSLARDKQQNVWVGSSAGLFVIPPGLPARQLTHTSVTSLLRGGPDMLVATVKDLLKFAPDLTSTVVRSSIGNLLVRSMLRGEDGSLWIGTASGVGHLTPGEKTVEWLGEAEGFPRGEVQALAEDQAGDVWAGYDGAGAVRLARAGFLTYGVRDGLSSTEIASMTLDSKGRLLVTTTTRPGLTAYRFESGRFVRQELGLGPKYFPPAWVPWHQIVAAHSAGALWTASNRGLLQLKADGSDRYRLSHSLTKREGLPADDVAHVFEDSKGNLWFSTLPVVAYPPPGRQTGLGVLERSTGKIRVFSEADGLPPLNLVSILYLFEDHAGQMWIGLHRTGVARYRDGRFQLFTPKEGIPEGGIRYIYEDSRKRLWIGSGRGGLGRIDDPTAERPTVQRYSTADGLSSDEIQAITEDNFGRIYVGTGLGVDCVDPASGSIVHYTRADGLAEGEVQDAVRDRNGDLWFGTYHGVSRLHPVADAKMDALPVTIASVKVNGRPLPTRLGAEHVSLPDLPPGNNGVEIQFLALAAAGPQSIRYQYRMDGDKEPWGAPSAARTVTYSNLRAGTYTFEVRSLADSPGPSATVRFVVLPHFWESWSFIISVVAVVLAILYTIHRFRMDNLLRIQQVRTRIANDLHDDIGSGLSKIVILSEVAQRNGRNSHAAALDRIAETSREVLDAVGDLVWTTNASNETVGDLVRRMRSFATQLFEAKEIEFEMQTVDLPLEKVLPPDSLRHLYLIFKEAVNNAARHAQCSRVRVLLRHELGAFLLQVSDDGIGFVPAAKPGHHGLENLKARAAHLKGAIEWRVESGTTVELNVPYLFK